MPYKVTRGKGDRKWKIMRKSGGKWQVVGSSETKRMANASVRARHADGK